MQKAKTKVTPIFLIHLSISHEILEVKKIRAKKKQTHRLEMTSKNNYYSDTKEIQRENQVYGNESLTFKMRSNIERL